MPNFNIRLKALRQEAELSQQEFANKIGLSKSSINMYERGEREPSIDTLEIIADYFNIDMDYLLGKSNIRNKYAILECPDNENPWEVELRDAFDKLDLDSQISVVEQVKALGIKNIVPLPKHKKIPLLGTIACGEPIFAEENVDGYVQCPEDVEADFCLRCKGDSMIGARIHDGDIVYIKQQQTIENGEIAAVLIDDEATLKRVYKKGDSLILQPENPAYEPLIFVREEMNEVRILGKAVCFLSKVR